MMDYRGIREGYPRIPLSRKIKAVGQLVRPFTLIGAFLSGFALTILFSKVSSIPIVWGQSVYVGLIMALLQGGGQALNQSIEEEVEIDVINGKTYRPTVEGILSLKEGKIISTTLFTVACLMAGLTNLVFFMMCLIISFFAVAYTVQPFRMKKYFLVSNVWQGVARGLLPWLAVSTLFPNLGWFPLWAGLPLMVWCFGAQATKDFGDEIGDKKFGIRTFPAVLGREKAIKLMGLFMAVGFVTLNTLIFLRLLPLRFLILNFLVVSSIFIVYGLKKGLKTERWENNPSWLAFYGSLGLYYLIPVVLV